MKLETIRPTIEAKHAEEEPKVTRKKKLSSDAIRKILSSNSRFNVRISNHPRRGGAR